MVVEGMLLEERGENAELKQVEKKEFSISTFWLLVTLAVTLPRLRTGMESYFFSGASQLTKIFCCYFWDSGSWKNWIWHHPVK